MKKEKQIIESAPDLVIKCLTKLFTVSFMHAAYHTPVMPKYKGP